MKLTFFVFSLYKSLAFLKISAYPREKFNIVDLTRPAIWKDMSNYYGALAKQWKICVNCGIPGLGTAMHLEHSASVGSMYPAHIPPEYLITRLMIIDVSSYAEREEEFTLSLEVALQWQALRRDPPEPTLLLFRFGWRDEADTSIIENCVCKIPGISYELAEWIAANLTRVVGVATDTPTLESPQTREFATRTVSNLLGKNGVYMIENTNIKRKMKVHGCMTIAMPLKLLHSNYVPTRLTAFCPVAAPSMKVSLALHADVEPMLVLTSRLYDVNLDEILN